jgi:hypothetical protein
MRWLILVLPLAACAPAPPAVAPDPAYDVCGPNGSVDWDDNPSAPPPHCNRNGWNGHSYDGDAR